MNFPSTTITWPVDIALALNYVRGEDRNDFTALLRFDRTLATTVSGARDPALAQLRLAWWRTQLDAPVAGSDGYEAVVMFGAKLMPLIDGWERLLSPLPLDEAVLQDYANGRGATIFALLGGHAATGAGWALADFARHCTDTETRSRARRMADTALSLRLSGQPKPLRVMARLARAEAITRWTLVRAALG
ncbi:squalene/phytoene synthase family protein [Sphingomonas antarctica]|uniref:squalene/phytoene synthase family protein n=1 Tax=Sphingomonas antarctica TaxID=2040274 RepID=UPI0039EB0BA4